MTAIGWGTDSTPVSQWIDFNTLRPRQNGHHFADDILKRIFLNENIWIPIKISLKFVPEGSINNIPVLVQIMAWRRPGDKPLSEPMMVNLPTHICVTRPQWVNGVPGNIQGNLDKCVTDSMMIGINRGVMNGSTHWPLVTYYISVIISSANERESERVRERQRERDRDTERDRDSRERFFIKWIFRNNIPWNLNYDTKEVFPERDLSREKEREGEGLDCICLTTSSKTY